MSAKSHVTMTDLTRAGYCARGVKSWFDGRGEDFRKFLAEGMTVERLKVLAETDANAANILRRILPKEGD